MNPNIVRAAVTAVKSGSHTPNHVIALRKAHTFLSANKSHAWNKSPSLHQAFNKVGLGIKTESAMSKDKALFAQVVNHLIEEEGKKKARKPWPIRPSELSGMIKASRDKKWGYGLSVAVNHPEVGQVTFDKFFNKPNQVGHRLDTRSFSDQERLVNFLRRYGVEPTIKGPSAGGEAAPVGKKTKKTKKLKETLDEDREF